MYLKKLVLENIRGFENLTLDFSAEPDACRLRTLILGRNGTCKTTLLRAIGLGLSDISGVSALLEIPTGGFVRNGCDAGRIDVSATNASTRKEFARGVEIKRVDEREISGTSSGLNSPTGAIFVCGYGAGRWGFGTDGRMSKRTYRVSDSIGNLFDYRTSLADPELTLRRLKDFLGTAKYESAMKGLRRALGLTDKDTIELVTGGGVEVDGPSVGGRISLQAWADGYRLTFGWMLDLYAWAIQAERIGESGDVEGILLIDEIEQHLHPSMQASVMSRLSEVLPRMQVIATTHSPLVAMGAAPGEVVALRREKDRVLKEDAVPDFRGWSAEDLLVDDRLFDTSAYAPDTTEQLRKYQDLAEVPPQQRSAAQKKELKDLAQTLLKQQVPEVRESETVKDLRKLVEKHGL
jgi:hypothetical protein